MDILVSILYGFSLGKISLLARAVVTRSMMTEVCFQLLRTSPVSNISTQDN